MSDLQTSLIIVGVVVVAGVYIFNLFQDRKYQRQTEKIFSGEPDEQRGAGLQTARVEAPIPIGDTTLRIEPQLETVLSYEELPAAQEIIKETKETPPVHPRVIQEKHSPQPRVEVGVPGIELDSAIEYIVQVHAGDPLQTQALAPAIAQSTQLGKAVRWVGLSQETQAWESVMPEGNGLYIELRVGIQLTDRNGAVSDEQLSAFCELIRELAAAQFAIAECPDRSVALATAQDLDQFCVDVDVLIGLNVVAQAAETFPGTKIRAFAEAAGMKLDSEGVFHYRNEHGDSLFSLCNHESTPFAPDNVKQLTTHGVTLVFDVPRVADGLRVFDQMAALGGRMTHALGGVLVDDNIRPLSDAGLEKIRSQLRNVYAKMQTKQVPPGSPRALRLFS